MSASGLNNSNFEQLVLNPILAMGNLSPAATASGMATASAPAPAPAPTVTVNPMATMMTDPLADLNLSLASLLGTNMGGLLQSTTQMVTNPLSMLTQTLNNAADPLTEPTSDSAMDPHNPFNAAQAQSAGGSEGGGGADGGAGADGGGGGGDGGGDGGGGDGGD